MNKILSNIHKYKSPVVIYGNTNNIYEKISAKNKKIFSSYDNINYNYYPIIQSNETIRKIKYGIILSNEACDYYLSIYIPNKSISSDSFALEWWKNNYNYQQYLPYNIDNFFQVCLTNLETVFEKKHEYINAYYQILKLYFVAKTKYFVSHEIISLLSCALKQKKVELLDIDINCVL